MRIRLNRLELLDDTTPARQFLESIEQTKKLLDRKVREVSDLVHHLHLPRENEIESPQRVSTHVSLRKSSRRSSSMHVPLSPMGLQSSASFEAQARQDSPKLRSGIFTDDFRGFPTSKTMHAIPSPKRSEKRPPMTYRKSSDGTIESARDRNFSTNQSSPAIKPKSPQNSSSSVAPSSMSTPNRTSDHDETTSSRLRPPAVELEEEQENEPVSPLLNFEHLRTSPKSPLHHEELRESYENTLSQEDTPSELSEKRTFRTRKSVNYALPSLRSKMRREDTGDTAKRKKSRPILGDVTNSAV